MQEQATPNLFQRMAAQLSAALAIPGFSPFVPTHRRHKRRFTRAYADGRQKMAHGLYALEQKRVAELHKGQKRVQPAPSAKALARRLQRNAKG